VNDRPDPATPDVDQLDRAEVELRRHYRVTSLSIVEGVAPEHVPADVVASWPAADARRQALIAEMAQRAVVRDADVESIEGPASQTRPATMIAELTKIKPTVPLEVNLRRERSGTRLRHTRSPAFLVPDR
jgi:hypothetical protein